MASWVDVKGFIRNNYKLQDDEGDCFKIVFNLGSSRSQVVFIQKIKTRAGDIWIQISSPVGIIEQENIDDALEYLNENICGGMVKIGHRHFVRHCLPIEDLSSDEFDVPLRVVTMAADELEQKFVGGDRN